MSFTVGETVVVRGTLAVVVRLDTVAGQDFVGVVPLQAVQYVPAAQVNAPPNPGAPATPAAPAHVGPGAHVAPLPRGSVK